MLRTSPPQIGSVRQPAAAATAAARAAPAPPSAPPATAGVAVDSCAGGGAAGKDSAGGAGAAPAYWIRRRPIAAAISSGEARCRTFGISSRWQRGRRLRQLQRRTSDWRHLITRSDHLRQNRDRDLAGTVAADRQPDRRAQTYSGQLGPAPLELDAHARDLAAAAHQPEVAQVARRLLSAASAIPG